MQHFQGSPGFRWHLPGQQCKRDVRVNEAADPSDPNTEAVSDRDGNVHERIYP